METQEIIKAKTIEEYLNLKNTASFFDFSSGVDVDERQIQDYIIVLVKRMRDQNITQRQSICSGNTMVEVFYHADDQKAEIIISKNYKKAELLFKEEGIVDLGGIPLQKELNSNKWTIKYKEVWDT